MKAHIEANEEKGKAKLLRNIAQRIPSARIFHRTIRKRQESNAKNNGMALDDASKNSSVSHQYGEEGKSVAKGAPDEVRVSYVDGRKDHVYYGIIRGLLKAICRENDSICDVGSFDTDMLSDLPCKRKLTVDLRTPFSSDDVEGIKADYLQWQAEKLDVITCFQVLEHIDDNHVEAFAKKLLNDAPVAVVSVPYMWPKGSCKWHVQDPVDVEKLVGWFGKKPVFIQKAKEKFKSPKNSRIIAIFVRGVDGEIDMDYWKKDAEKHVSAYSK